MRGFRPVGFFIGERDKFKDSLFTRVICHFSNDQQEHNRTNKVGGIKVHSSYSSSIYFIISLDSLNAIRFTTISSGVHIKTDNV